MIVATTAPLLYGIAFGISRSNLHRRAGCPAGWSTHHGRVSSVPIMHFASTSSHPSDEPSSPSQAELDVLQLAQSHFSSQALLAAMRLGVLDELKFVYDDSENADPLTVDEIITRLHRTKNQSAPTINRDALFRCLRLLCTVRVIEERSKIIDGMRESAFVLTEMGQLLQSPEASESMGSFVLHWAELPIWDAWAELPDYVAGNSGSQDSGKSCKPPFDRANGMSASDYYMNNPQSCQHRNAVARHASSKEITSILNVMESSTALNESNLTGKTVVDIGGGYGDLMHELEKSMPSVGKCYCLDLPDVINDAMATNTNDDETISTTLVPGNMFDPSTIPNCDFILTKHVLCDFDDENVIRALQSFHKALSPKGKVVIMDAVLPNGDALNGKYNAAVSFDVLLMLTGRRAERSGHEWSNLAAKAGFQLEEILTTSSVTVDLAILSKEL